MSGILLDSKAVHELTGLGRDACYALFHMSGFKFVKIGEKKYTTREWLMQFLESIQETVE